MKPYVFWTGSALRNALCALLSLALWAPSVAARGRVRHAPDAVEDTQDTQDAQALRVAAAQAFSNGSYDEALRGFQAAYDKSGEPTDLFNLGRIHEETADLSAALQYYERFAAQPHLDLEERRLAAERIEVLRVLVHQESAPEPPSVGGPALASTKDDPRPRGGPLLVSGGTLVALGVGVAVAGGLTSGLRGRRAREDINGLADGENPQRLTLSEAEDLDTRGRNADVALVTFVASGGAVALLGATLLTLGLVRRSKQSRASVQAQLSPRHAFISTTWKF